MHRKNIYLFILFILLFFITENLYAKNKHIKISQFISPEVCSDCHSEIYNQWQNSMHNLAQKDPIYFNVAMYFLKGLTNENEIKEAQSCVKCHVPSGYVTGFPTKTSQEQDKLPQITKQGIFCDYCHSAVTAEKMYNNDLKLDPGNDEDDPGIKRGPFKDSESDFHDSSYSKFHTSAKICGTCHDVKHVVYNTDLETTYTEWKNGPYNLPDPNKRINCQGCHMYQTPTNAATGSTKRDKIKGRAADDGPIRDHIFTHYFVGANSVIPAKFNDKTKSKMAVSRLKNAAKLFIDTKQVENGLLVVKIKNTGAGHKIPTGLTDVRQMWLQIIIKNDDGKTIFSSGVLDKNNYMPKDAIIFNTVYGDGKGNPIINVAKAREILKDKRIKPLQTAVEKIKIPKKINSTYIYINVKLLYRSAPQKIVDLVSKNEKLKLPITVMDEVKQKVSL